MRDKLKNSYSECKKLYRDIIFGYSEVRLESVENKVFVKHLDEMDSNTTDREYEDYLHEAQESGLKNEKDALDFMIEEGLWSWEQEQNLESLKEELSTLEATKKKLIVKVQQKPIEKRIKPIKQEVYLLSQERNDSIGLTAEGFASKKINEFMVYKAFYKDKELKELLYTEEEFDVLSNTDLAEIMNCFADTYAIFNDDQVKLISVCPFFMNNFSLCGDDAYAYFGKPIIELTNFQISLLNTAKYTKSLMGNSKSPPEEYYKAPKSLFEWYELNDKSRQVKDGLNQKGEAGASTVVGATKQELGAVAQDGEEVIDLNKLAKEKGEISFEDLMDLHGL